MPNIQMGLVYGGIKYLESKRVLWQRKQVQDIFRRTARNKQVMMLSATIGEQSKNAQELYVFDGIYDCSVGGPDSSDALHKQDWVKKNMGAARGPQSAQPCMRVWRKSSCVSVLNLSVFLVHRQSQAFQAQKENIILDCVEK